MRSRRESPFTSSKWSFGILNPHSSWSEREAPEVTWVLLMLVFTTAAFAKVGRPVFSSFP